MSFARFLVAVGPSASLDRLQERMASERLAFSRPSEQLLYHCGKGRPVVHEPGCLAIGHIWPKGQEGTAGPLGALDVDAALRSAGRSIVERHWGPYFLVTAPRPDVHLAMRDPSGAVHVSFKTDGPSHYYFSDAAIARQCGLLEPAIDLEFIRQWLAFPFLKTGRTGLSGLSELLPGMSRKVECEHSSIHLAWNPWDHAGESQQIGDFEEAGAALRQALSSTVPRAAGGDDRILLQLSGGLDSSILAALLGKAGAAVEAITYFTASTDGDERAFARRAAEAAHIPLSELPGEPESLELTIPEPRLVPAANPVLQPLHRLMTAQARQRGIGTLVSGAGGDNLFCYLTTAAPIVDAFRMGGIRQGLAAAGDLAAICGSTHWQAASAAIERIWRRPRAWRKDKRFLATGVADGEAEVHPWLEGSTALPGKLEHVEALVSIQHFLDRTPTDFPAQLHPLLSQPLIECCLTIPSWLWIRGGRDRAVARAAVRGLVPESLLARRAKGRLESLFLKGYRGLRSQLLELLPDGELDGAGLIDVAAIAGYCARPDPPDDAYIRILELAAAELWLRSWSR